MTQDEKIIRSKVAIICMNANLQRIHASLQDLQALYEERKQSMAYDILGDGSL